MQNLEWYLADLKSTGKNTIETVEKSLTDMFIRLVRIYPCLLCLYTILSTILSTILYTILRNSIWSVLCTWHGDSLVQPRMNHRKGLLPRFWSSYWTRYVSSPISGCARGHIETRPQDGLNKGSSDQRMEIGYHHIVQVNG